MSTPVQLELPLPVPRPRSAARTPTARRVRVCTSPAAERAPARRPARVDERRSLQEAPSEGWPGDVEGWLASLGGTLAAQFGAALNIAQRYASAPGGLWNGPASALWGLVGEFRSWGGSLAEVTL